MADNGTARESIEDTQHKGKQATGHATARVAETRARAEAVAGVPRAFEQATRPYLESLTGASLEYFDALGLAQLGAVRAACEAQKGWFQAAGALLDATTRAQHAFFDQATAGICRGQEASISLLTAALRTSPPRAEVRR